MSSDTPTTSPESTRPVRVPSVNDVGYAANALDGRAGPAFTDELDEPGTEPPDFSRRQRWMPVLLGALGIVVLAVLIARVIAVANDSTKPDADTENAPAPTVTSSVMATSVPATTTAVPSPSAGAPPASPSAPPPLPSVTATASTMAIPPPPAAPEPNPDVRQRLHDLFPRIFPNP